MGKAKERSWGPLSRTNALRAGSFCEDMNGDLEVFLDANRRRNEAEVEKLVERGRARFVLKEKPQHHQERERKGEEAETVEENNSVEGVPPDEIQKEWMMWLAERTTSIEKERRK